MMGLYFSKTIVPVLIAVLMAFVMAPGCDGGTTPPPSDVDCSVSTMLENPVNPGEFGPWPVGSTVMEVAELKTQIWYPALPGSEAGQSKYVITVTDMAEYLPELEGGDPADFHTFNTDYYMDLPLDTTHGPYPVIIYVHGTGSFRYASGVQFAHWASRGFVVICADNPWINFKDMYRSVLNVALATQKADTRDILKSLRTEDPVLDLINGHVDLARIGLSGHSAGGNTVSGLGDEEGVRVIITMASGGVDAGASVVSGMAMGGLDDGTVGWNSMVVSGYEDMTMKKRLLGIPEAGHMVFANICETIIKAPDYGIEIPALISMVANDGCGPDYLDEKISWDIVNYASAAVFEETLLCSPTAAGQMDQIVDYFEAQGVEGIIYEYAPAQE